MSAASNSLQQPRVRRGNAGSPGSFSNNGGGCRWQPVRATVPYQLLTAGQGSPSRGLSRSSSPTSAPGSGLAKMRLSPESRESLPPDAPGPRAERSKLQVRSSGAVRRAASLDAVTGPYLTGQWPRDAHGPYPSSMKDKATQTPGLWMEEGSGLGGPHQRSASWGSADHLKEIAKLRMQLQRSNRHNKEHAPQSQHKSSWSSIPAVPAVPVVPAVPAVKAVICRVPSSVEGINYELENVFIRQDWENSVQVMDVVVDGRRAPFPPRRYGNGGDTRDTDTQAPPSGESSPCSSEQLQSEDSPSSTEDTDRECSLPKLASSPKPNNSYTFKREPPEGCERVKVFEELESSHSKGFPLFSCPDKNKVNFIPRGSAFCPVKIFCSSLFSPVAAQVTSDPRGGANSDSDSDVVKEGAPHVLLTS